MSMVVQHNLQAMNSNRMLGVTTSAQSKSTEKLSSGYKINRAADDAAGLTISEKMRKQMRGLDRASTNAQDGVSSVQTAEGALTEVHSMLQRMNELAVQAANGTNSVSDREAIQAEIDQLSTEIDRVAETTKFNEIYLLKGDEGTKTINMEAHDAGLKGTLTDNGNGTATFSMDALEAGDSVTIAGKQYVIRDSEGGEAEGYAYNATGATATVSVTGWGTNAGQNTVTIGGVTIAGSATISDGAALAQAFNDDATFSASYKAEYDAASDSLKITALDLTKTAAAVAADITSATAGNTSMTPAAGDEVVETYDGDFTAKLYAAGKTGTLSEADAKNILKEGGKLYTSQSAADAAQAAGGSSQTEAVGYAFSGTGATATVSVTGWGTNAGQNTVTIDGVTIAGSATVSDGANLAQAFNDDATFSASYKAEYDAASDSLKITALDLTKTAADVAGAITAATAGNTSMTPAAGDEAVETYDGDFTAELYAAGGTEALSEEDAKAALRNGDKLYIDAAPKSPAAADNAITAEEAYAKIKDALLQANKIGDTNNTAAVKQGGASAQAAAEGYEYVAGTGATATVSVAGWGTTPAQNTVTIAGVTINGGAAASGAALAQAFNDDATFSASYKAEYDAASDSLKITALDLTKTATAVAGDITAAMAGNTSMTPAAGDEAVPDEYKGDFSAELYAKGGKTALTEEEAKEALKNGENLYTEPGADNVTFSITTGSADVAKTLSFNLHVGSDADLNNKIQVNIDTMNSAFLGVKGLNVTDKDGMAATYAIDAIADAIAKVSEQRSALGAVQNRLEHTISNLDNVVENTTAAESRIRDTDMAEEMVEYSKNNILAQAGQSMLAQANQSTQGVLSLLG